MESNTLSSFGEIENQDQIITLKSVVDGTLVKIDKISLRHCKLIHDILQDFGDSEEFDAPNDPNMTGENLKHIAEFAMHYRDSDPVAVPKPLKQYNISKTYGEWEQNFISKFLKTETDDPSAIFSLIAAADCIQCDALVELGASHLACVIKDLSGKQWLDYFGLQEDMTDDDVKKMHEDYTKKKQEEREKQNI